jgi:hypothetical protein
MYRKPTAERNTFVILTHSRAQALWGDAVQRVLYVRTHSRS